MSKTATRDAERIAHLEQENRQLHERVAKLRRALGTANAWGAENEAKAKELDNLQILERSDGRTRVWTDGNAVNRARNMYWREEVHTIVRDAAGVVTWQSSRDGRIGGRHPDWTQEP